MLRLIVFGDSGLPMARITLPAFVAAARAHPSVELLGVCDTRRGGSGPLRDALRRATVRAFGGGASGGRGGAGSFAAVAKENALPLFAPSGGDVNSAEFEGELRERYRPDLALSLGCLQIFRPPLLAVFRAAVNFHDGLLPAYRGLDATAWSIYRGERVTGYSFHHMTPGIDAGPVLLDGSVPVAPGSRAADLHVDKSRAAARRAEEVLARMIAFDPGRPQPAGGTYFSRGDGLRIRRIESPVELTAAEIHERLRCFGRLKLFTAGRWWEVTELAARGRPAFRTADGRTLAIRRALFLPPLWYRAYRALQPNS